MQERKTWDLAPYYATNQFATAHLDDLEKTGPNSLKATILPENTPINPSPWYAFKLWSSTTDSVDLTLVYEHAKHRYPPKVSSDGKNWELLDTNLVNKLDDGSATLRLQLSPDTLWLAAQPISSSKDVANWCQNLVAQHDFLTLSEYGRSRADRPLWMIDCKPTDARKKPTVVLMSRQHPPEVTGWHALQAFIEGMMGDDEMSKQFRDNFRVLIFPLLNPDGVDEGFWRHNLGGIDMNRDWAYYHQPENKQMVDAVFAAIKEEKSEVWVGMDFHSTFYDVFYTNDETKMVPALPGFKDDWLTAIEAGIPGYERHEKPSNIGKPVSKNWFFIQFGAVGVTYEIGDETDPAFTKEIGKVSAQAMMKLLLERL